MTKLTYKQQVQLERRLAAQERAQERAAGGLDERQERVKLYQNTDKKVDTAVRTPQHKRHGYLWEVAVLNALNVHCTLPAGATTIPALFNERVMHFMVQGVNGKLPVLDQPELARRHNTLTPILLQIQENFNCFGFEVAGFNGVAFAQTVEENAEGFGLRWIENRARRWYEGYRPFAVTAEDATIIAREIDERILAVAAQAWPSVA